MLLCDLHSSPCTGRLRRTAPKLAQGLRPDGGTFRRKDTTAAGADESDHRPERTNRTGQQRARRRT